MTLTVEFLGLPGSGKSTLAAAAADRLRERGLNASVGNSVAGGRWSKLIHYCAFLLRRPGYFFRSVRAVVASDQISSSDLKRALLTWVKRSARAMSASDTGEIRLVDAGIFQALWSVAYSSAGEEPLRHFRLLPHPIPLPDLLLVVEVELETAANRLQTRAGRTSRLERDLESGSEALARARHALEATLEVVESCARRHTDFEVLHITNESELDIERNTREIVEGIIGSRVSRKR